MINNVDLDGNTVLDFKEFLAMMENSVVNIFKNKLLLIQFEIFGGSLKYFLNKSLQSDVDDSAELKHVFAIFDKNGDGYICK